jgi:hypothetical protein
MLMGMNTRPDPRRRLFQFSLKSVFILILVIAAFFGGMAVKQRQMEMTMAEAEQARVEAQLQAEKALYAEQLAVAQALHDSAAVVKAGEDQPAQRQQ